MFRFVWQSRALYTHFVHTSPNDDVIFVQEVDFVSILKTVHERGDVTRLCATVAQAQEVDAFGIGEEKKRIRVRRCNTTQR